MMGAIRRLLDEIMVPSGDESGYTWAVVAAGHVLLGAAFAWCWPLALPVYAAKEALDLRRGGRWRDGLVDLGFVALGLCYAGPWWWPVLALAGIAAGAVIRENGGADDRAQ